MFSEVISLRNIGTRIGFIMRKHVQGRSVPRRNLNLRNMQPQERDQGCIFIVCSISWMSSDQVSGFTLPTSWQPLVSVGQRDIVLIIKKKKKNFLRYTNRYVCTKSMKEVRTSLMRVLIQGFRETIQLP